LPAFTFLFVFETQLEKEKHPVFQPQERLLYVTYGAGVPVIIGVVNRYGLYYSRTWVQYPMVAEIFSSLPRPNGLRSTLIDVQCVTGAI
jgi:hypothetical protein